MVSWNLPTTLPSEGETLEVARKVIEEGWKRGVKTEVFVTSLVSLTISSSREELTLNKNSKWTLGIRVNGSGLAYTNDPRKALDSLEVAIKSYKVLGERPLAETKPIVDRVSQKLKVPPWDVELERKVRDVKEMVKLAKGSVIAAYREVYGYKLYSSSEGSEIIQRLSYSIHSSMVTLEEGGQRGSGYWSEGSREGYVTDPVSVVKKAVRKAENQLRGKGIEPGRWEVLLLPPAIGVMVHEALGHMSEADHVKAGSPLKKGEKIAPEYVTVIDSPGSGIEWGSIFYDDEGVKPVDVEIVKNGVVNGFLTDRAYAAELNLPLTGNGRHESPLHRVIPRMRVTYVKPGDWSKDELMRELRRGVVIYDTSGGNAENDGTFFFMSQEAWYVENGEEKYPLKPMGIAGNVLVMLKEVKAVGKEMDLRPGTCGKWGQGVPVSVGGGPTLTTLNLSPI
ncbi:hypothetical protein EYM_04850 [Ignicoccus islandicus DSM 13165]|uniref:Peptidase U62 modulator of DNA gyrase n=1 Tax=Ignicoccus islandicus DSM 13165 TaxID=940295 RepID=A0A0U3E3N5_9CREN|nr:TldD/PmbA family protein [Ignicoccus islandicus]ALU12523.1 hypothetical protein EYM_04850 [Ignicoccus islandicus DSM 13165]